MRRLYQKIYLIILASLLTVVLIVGLFWRLGQPDRPYSQAFEIAGELAMAALPPADAPRRLQQQAVEQSRAAPARRSRAVRCGSAADRRRRRIRCRRRRTLGWVRGMGRAGLELPPAGWALDRGARAGARSESAVRRAELPPHHGAGDRDLRLSGGARADQAASSGCRRASRRSAPAISRPASRSAAATRSRGSPTASTARRRGSRSWSAPTGCCSPMPRTSCARRCRACASASSSTARTRRPKRRPSSNATSPSSTI